MKTGSDTLGTVENESVRQNMKTESDALSTAKNESMCKKHKKGT
jgi:hypothetical protein